MHEYAIMAGVTRLPGSRIAQGTVINVVMTTRPLSQLTDYYQDYEVVPIEMVSQRSLLDYRYWDVRP